MRTFSVAVAALLIANDAIVGFLPLPQPARTRNPLAAVSMAQQATGVDVSIPYDAAARLAYEEWREEYNKGVFDDARFGIFKNNYETVTIANVKAKKKAREDATVSLSLMSLNEFGDLTAEEYQQVAAGGPPPTKISTGDVLGSAVKAAALQTEASNALEEASDALAIEEQKLVDALGLESVEELEVAIDSMEGIAPDGGELETSNIAREARVRDAYLNWCKQFGKEPSEPRYEAFSQNFLFMEKFEKGTGKEMTLNQYADYTKEEYEAMQKKEAAASKESKKKATSSKTPLEASTEKTSASSPKAEVSPPPKPPPSPPKTGTSVSSEVKSEFESPIPAEAVEEIGKNLLGVFGMAAGFAQAAAKGIGNAIQEGLEEIDERAQRNITIDYMGQEVPEDEEEAKALALARAAEKAVLVADMAMRAEEAEKAVEEARQQRLEEMAEKAKLEAERRKVIEKERAEREKQNAAELARAQVEAEQAAIAAAKAEEEKQATFAAQRAYFDQLAAEEVRRKAQEFDAKQRKLEEEKRKKAVPKKEPAANVFQNLVSRSGVESKGSTSSAQAMKKSRPTAPKFAPKKQAMKKVILKMAPPKKAMKVTSSPTIPLFGTSPPPKKAKTVSSPTFSLFGAQAPKKPEQKAALPPPPAPTPKKVTSSASTFSLFGSTPKKAKKAAAVAPAPVPAPAPKKQAPAPAFSLFGSSPPKKVAPKKVAPAAVPSPAPKRTAPSPSFSLFGGKPKKAATKVETPVAPASVPAPPAAAPAFSFFGSAPKAAKKASQPKAEPNIPNRPGTLSLFGNTPKGTKKTSQPKADNRPGTLSVFGVGGAPKKAKKAPKIPNRGGTINIFSATGAEPKQVVSKGATGLGKQQSFRGLFGSTPKPMSQPKVQAPEPQQATAKGSAAAKPAFSLFGGSNQSMGMAMAQAKSAPPSGVPVLSRWRQNPDGSITGKVSGSSNFRTGTEITTSPVQKGASSGSLVKTGSGSQYFLS